MGEIAEMMLDGTLCEGCGAANMGESHGVPWRCQSCRKEARARQQIKKVPCPTCGKRVKTCGLVDHQRDAHGGKEGHKP